MRDRKPPQTGASEKEVLTGFLTYLREGVPAKVEGVPEPQVRAPGVDSGTNLLGLVKHLGSVERYLFLGEEPGRWSSTFRATKRESVEGLVERYLASVAEADEVIASCEDLSDPVPRGERTKPTPSMRWALTHMIEETARHAGHLDIIRERIDGATGR